MLFIKLPFIKKPSQLNDGSQNGISSTFSPLFQVDS